MGYEEQATCWLYDDVDDDDILFVLSQHAELDHHNVLSEITVLM
jgi:flavorubredoxin